MEISAPFSLFLVRIASSRRSGRRNFLGRSQARRIVGVPDCQRGDFFPVWGSSAGPDRDHVRGRSPRDSSEYRRRGGLTGDSQRFASPTTKRQQSLLRIIPEYQYSCINMSTSTPYNDLPLFKYHDLFRNCIGHRNEIETPCKQVKRENWASCQPLSATPMSK